MEVREGDPVAAVLVARKVSVAVCVMVLLGNGQGFAHKRRARGAKRLAVGAGLRQEQAAARVGAQVVRVHGHVADQENAAGPAASSA